MAKGGKKRADKSAGRVKDIKDVVEVVNEKQEETKVEEIKVVETKVETVQQPDLAEQ